MAKDNEEGKSHIMCRSMELGIEWRNSKNIFQRIASSVFLRITIQYGKIVEAMSEKQAWVSEEEEIRMKKHIMEQIQRRISEKG